MSGDKEFQSLGPMHFIDFFYSLYVQMK